MSGDQKVRVSRLGFDERQVPDISARMISAPCGQGPRGSTNAESQQIIIPTVPKSV
jgi:hypothetical protein